MINAPTNAGSAEVTAIDTQARGPLLLLLGSGVVWLVVSGILALITSIQLHSPHFFADCSWFTFGRSQALRETTFVYGWAANAGLAIALWVMGRLGGYPLRALNWTVVGTLFWNTAIAAGLIGIATGDMTSFSLLQMPRYVQPLLVVAYASIGISGVLAWSGRKTDGTYASQWYGIAALFLFPWLLCAAQAVLLWWPVRGTVQAIAAGWYTQGVWSLWLSPLALVGAYYIVPKVAGRVLPSYDSAPLGFWTLIFVGAWTGGRHLIGGPVPAWIATMAVVSAGLLVFHYLVVALNFRIVFSASGNAIKFIRTGLIAYFLVGAFEFITSFRAIAVGTQFTFVASAIEQLGIYGGISMMFFGAMYFMVPRLTGRAWAYPGMVTGHRVVVTLGIALSIAALTYAGITQGEGLLDPKSSFAQIFGAVSVPLLINSGAQLLLLSANLLLLVNFLRSACESCCAATPATAESLFRQASKLEAHAS
ncbi:cbb3-type cytochrome c oxidase subunit I [Horticoccus sp. 23ND18S-11]|uniref:cbb3-type cytochrome c oxidase subunit I n=1 Tax=Horticoccus sp. 23ND18S-11 TaxID=3391832 RepID=UPI0039C952D7